ncbi:MAG: hypothetical protein ACD_60C00028G0054 [uncultured bacterium]|nr:MAG: hypothetical protein ACD_60C00028G0054 [uncultured bacterium]
MAVKSILMVCRGNICRSPMAEGFFLHQLKEHRSILSIRSAGLNALVDRPADANALAIMQQRGIDISAHRASQITYDFVQKADLVLVMTQSQLQTLTRQFVTAKGKTFMLGHWQQFEIEDPYTQPSAAFEYTYRQIELAWQDWKTRILSC